MANVKRERGQVILITGLLIAVAMVALVLLLNTAIFTENLASRGADHSGREAVEYRGTVVDTVEGLMERENTAEHGSQSAVETDLESGIDGLDNATAENYATRGAAVEVVDGSVTLADGELIRQTDRSRDFSSAGGATTTWNLATHVQSTRDYRMTVDRDGLVVANASDSLTEGAFAVRAGATQWRATVYENWSTGEVAIAVNDGLGFTQRCSLSAPGATFDLALGTINGSDCPGLVFAEGVPAGYTIDYDNAENATGTYNLTVEEGSLTAFTGLNDGTTNPTSPYHVPAVYSTSLTLRYRSPTLNYSTAIRVAPGEPE